jgi:predicted SAM-dependent methyltransferase
MENNQKKQLNLGCGRSKRKECINVDSCKDVDPDVLWDLNKFPYPFEDNSFDEILAYAILEHLEDTVAVMEELHRISRPNALLHISVPYWAYGFITKARYKIVNMKRIYHPKLKWIPKFIKKRLRLVLNEIVIGLEVTMQVVK